MGNLPPSDRYEELVLPGMEQPSAVERLEMKLAGRVYVPGFTKVVNGRTVTVKPYWRKIGKGSGAKVSAGSSMKDMPGDELERRIFSLEVKTRFEGDDFKRYGELLDERRRRNGTASKAPGAGVGRPGWDVPEGYFKAGDGIIRPKKVKGTKYRMTHPGVLDMEKRKLLSGGAMTFEHTSATLEKDDVVTYQGTRYSGGSDGIDEDQWKLERTGQVGTIRGGSWGTTDMTMVDYLKKPKSGG